MATELVPAPVSCNRQKPGGKKRAWRIFKICLLTFFSLILFLSGIVACLVNFVFTPEKVTPVVERIASDYLDAEVKMGSVELTFFSTYPRVALDVKDGLVVSHALKDSCFDKTDTLIGFKDCRIKANLGAYLARKAGRGAQYHDRQRPHVLVYGQERGFELRYFQRERCRGRRFLADGGFGGWGGFRSFDGGFGAFRYGE